jgi:hypothetical protein
MTGQKSFSPEPILYDATIGKQEVKIPRLINSSEDILNSWHVVGNLKKI